MTIPKIIAAVMKRDSCEPYASGSFPFIPYVTFSTHPRFVEGKRFDYGFLQCALQDGYRVTIHPPTEEDIRALAEERVLVKSEG